jgi:hypothetical protein
MDPLVLMTSKKVKCCVTLLAVGHASITRRECHIEALSDSQNRGLKDHMPDPGVEGTVLAGFQATAVVKPLMVF